MINNTSNSLPASNKATPKGVKAPDRRLNKKQWREFWQRRFSELNLESKGLKQNQQL
jgi:hypothetical protein